ncbi:GntR family transcriptional regulator [soil metagenome]
MGDVGAQTLVGAETSEGRCIREIRRMILSGELLPGQKVHQATVAESLNVSRIPVREALSRLHAEGVLEHKPNTGYTVSRFSVEDLREIYLIRRLLETELLRSIELSEVPIDELKEIDAQLSVVSPVNEPDEYQRLNKLFHFTLYDRSPLALVRSEVSNLWYRSSFYRSLYANEIGVGERVHHDHALIIDAIRSRDMDALIAASDQHRQSTETLIVQRLGRSRPR